jgi:hypothetical protein
MSAVTMQLVGNVVKENTYVWKIQTETGLVSANEDKYTLKRLKFLPVLEIS